MTVLVAHPQRLLAEAMGAALNGRDGIDVLNVFPNTGDEAVENAQRLKPAVALVDFRIADPDGPETTRRLSAKTPSCKVILLSWFHGMKEIEDALDAGAVGFFTTSFSIEKVAAGIRRAAAGDSPVFLEELERHFASLSKRSEKAAKLTEQFGHFSPREMTVLYLLSMDYSIKEVAAEIQISPTTVKTYIKSMMRKTNSLSHQEILVKARFCGLLRT
ncbi:MAG: response regulator transcription factor [Actinomycetota bacterium]